MAVRAIEADPAAADVGQLERLKDIWELLKRAERLGWSITLSPEKAKSLADLLETCGIFKLDSK